MKIKLMRAKKFMRTSFGRATMFGAALALLAASFGPIMRVFAAAPVSTDGYASIQINNATSLDNSTNVGSVTAHFGNDSLTISSNNGGLYSDGTNTVYVPVDSNVVLNASGTGKIIVDGYNSNGSTYYLNTIANKAGNAPYIVDVNFEQNTQSNGNTTSSINVSVGDGVYQIDRYDPDLGEMVTVEENYNDEIDFRINGIQWNPESSTISYNSASNTVMFTFESLWIDRYYEDIEINNVTYDLAELGINYDDRTWWLEHNNGTQMVSFSIEVPKAATYNIVAKHGENNGERFLATFLWTGDPVQAGGHDYIGHSKLEFVKAKYGVGDEEFTVTEDDIEGNTQREGDFDVFHSIDGFLAYGVKADVDYDDGNLTLPGESEVTMRVVPEYGYQVTSVNGGEDFVTNDAGVSEFTLVLHNGEAGYFQATVEEVDNVVDAMSEKVKAGEITLGENANNDIQSGTVVLSVEDVDLGEDKIAEFEDRATEAGDYKITSYLDINLTKVLYKGTAEDVWAEQIHHLTDKALITLQLEDGVDGNNIVIVHNIDDGEEFEIIPIESYDPVTNTITFYTDSFSNYAIAAKTVNSPETGSLTDADTGAAVSIYGVVATLVVVAVIAILCYNRRHDFKQR